MAVQRRGETEVDAPPLMVAQAIRTVLGQSPRYRHTTEQGTCFVTNVRPHWWLLGTAMTIEFRAVGTRTQVSVTTRSQWFILGDVFDYYNGYITEFLSHLVAKLGEEARH